MKELMKPEQSDLIRLLRTDSGLQPPEAPYARDIFLLEVLVAGTTHVVGLEELEPFLQPGERLTLIRVPDNPSDPFAIKVYNRDRVKLGYVPREQNLVLARLMDAGKELYAILTEKGRRGDWLRLRIQIFLHEE